MTPAPPPGATLLVDSVVIIDHLAGLPQATSFLVENRYKTVLSVITRAEVLAGPASDPEGPVRVLLDHFPTLTIDRDAADEAASARRAYGLRLPDAFQVALAVRYGLRLVTRDTRHLRPDRFPFVLVPYEV